MAPIVAVVGTGLAGLSSAYELSKILQAELPDARVIVFEKNPMFGGNSMKASSGINAVNAAAGDTQQTYSGDTVKSGEGLSKEDLVAQLVVRRFVLPVMAPAVQGQLAGGSLQRLRHRMATWMP